MYEERRNFSFRTVIVQLLFVVLFVFIMIWLLPTKDYLGNKYATKDDINTILDSRLESLYGRMFADNVETMRDAATGYFTNERLPQEVGESVTLSLDDMLEKKLVMPFKDSNNEACGLETSYVKITKMDNEYQMKVQLSCSDYSDYIIVYLGCYDYCEKDICEAKAVEPTAKPTTKPSSKPTKPTPIAKKEYEYEYRLTTQNEYSNWGNWSDWSTSKVKSDNLTQVEMKKQDVFVGYEQVEGIVSYKEETETITKTEVVPGYTDVKNATKSTSDGYYTNWVYQGYVTSYYGLSTYVSSNSTVKYVYVSDRTTLDCSNVCKDVTIYTYQKYTRSYVKGTNTYSCAAYPGYTLSGDKCVKYISGTSTQVPVTNTKKVPVYGYVNGDPIYEEVTKYRFRKRTLISEAKTVYKWSQNKNDITLLDQGYVLTNKSREV